MALAPINIKPKPPKKGGGLFGKALGAIGGGVVAALTGGAAIPAIAAGSAIGGAAGEMAKPTKAGASGRGVGMSRLANTDPKQQYLQIRNAQEQMLKESLFKPEEQEKYNDIFERAKLRLKERF